MTASVSIMAEGLENDADAPTLKDHTIDLPIDDTRIDKWFDIADHKDTNGKVYVFVKQGYMPGVKAGDKISATYSGGQGNFVYKTTGGQWKKRGADVTGNDWFDVTGTSTYTFTVDSDEVAQALAQNGLYLDGDNTTISNVKFIACGREEKPEISETGTDIFANTTLNPNGSYETRLIWKTGMPISSVNGTSDEIELGNDWLTNANDGGGTAYTQAFHIPAEKFFPQTPDNEDGALNSDLDDCIVVTFSKFDNGAQASFYFCDNNEEWFKRGVGDLESVADYFDVDHTGTYERRILNYRTVAALRTHGLYIDGTNATISKIELRNYNNEALSDDYPRFYGNPKQDPGSSVNEQRGYNITTDEGTATLSWETARRIRPVAFQNYVNGERIVMVFNKISDTPRLRLEYIRPYSASMRTAQGLTGTDDGIATNFTTLEDGRVAIVYRPTQREIRALKFNGLFLSGEGLELSELTFGLSDPDDQTQDLWIHNDWMTFGHSGEGKIYEGDIYHSGDVKIYISHIHFKRAKELNWLAQKNDEYLDYKLTFYFPWAGNNASMTLGYDSANVYDSNRDPLNRYFAAAYPGTVISQAPMLAEGETESGIYVENYPIPASKPQEGVFLDIPLESDHVKKMIDYGVWLQGSDADMQNVYLRSPVSVSGIDSVNQEESLLDVCINFSEPYEAYTIDGRRVADINDAPGLYIVRQGNKVQKILRR